MSGVRAWVFALIDSALYSRSISASSFRSGVSRWPRYLNLNIIRNGAPLNNISSILSGLLTLELNHHDFRDLLSASRFWYGGRIYEVQLFLGLVLTNFLRFNPWGHLPLCEKLVWSSNILGNQQIGRKKINRWPLVAFTLWAHIYYVVSVLNIDYTFVDLFQHQLLYRCKVYLQSRTGF